jgi:hypothetical protein
MLALFAAWPDWVSLLIVCVAIAYTACVFGVAFGKMGRSPLWGFLVPLPGVGTVALWIFGLGSWPQAAISRAADPPPPA